MIAEKMVNPFEENWQGQDHTTCTSLQSKGIQTRRMVKVKL